MGRLKAEGQMGCAKIPTGIKISGSNPLSDIYTIFENVKPIRYDCSQKKFVNK